MTGREVIYFFPLRTRPYSMYIPFGQLLKSPRLRRCRHITTDGILYGWALGTNALCVCVCVYLCVYRGDGMEQKN